MPTAAEEEEAPMPASQVDSRLLVDVGGGEHMDCKYSCFIYILYIGSCSVFGSRHETEGGVRKRLICLAV